MGAWYFKQPNGLYGRFSTVVDAATDWNLNEEELKLTMTNRLGANDYDVLNFDEFIKSDENSKRNYYLHKFEDVIENVLDGNETTESIRKFLVDCGVPKEEAEKYYFMDYPEYATADDPIWESYSPYLQKKEN